MTSRQPLGETTAPNRLVVRPGTYDKNSDERKYKKAIGDALDERRRRAEAEGLASAAKRGKEAATEEVERLKKELVRAKDKIARRDEKIVALGKAGSSIPSSESESLESKLRDLVQKHHESKEKHAAELRILRTENKELKDAAVASKSSYAKSIDTLRRHHDTVEAENKRLHAGLRDLQAVQAGSSRQTGKWEDERAKRRALEKELDDVKTELAKHIKSLPRVEHLQSEITALQEQKEQLARLLEDSAKAYAKLYRSSGPHGEHETTLRSHETQRHLREDGMAVTAGLRRELRFEREYSHELSIRLHQAQRDRHDAEEALEDLLEDRKLSRLEDKSHLPMLDDSAAPLAPLTTSDILPFVDLVISHTNMHNSLLSHDLHGLEATHQELAATHESSLADLVSARTTLTALQRSHADLSTSHAALQRAHAPCADNAADLKRELTHAQIGENTAKQVIEETKTEMHTIEERARGDREALKRANETVGRVKMAESAMVEEIECLKEALDRAQHYEELYETLLEQHRILQSREAVANEEVARIGQQNAELIGHANGDQKISYVETLRWEMALVKQELAGTRHMLNKANDRVRSLEEECEAYKAIDPISGLGASTRTRLVRRQPEGSRLVESMAASARGRSVSGPAGRR